MNNNQEITRVNNNPFWVFSVSIITIIGTIAGVIGIIPIIAESKTTKDMIQHVLMAPVFYFTIAIWVTIFYLNKLRNDNKKLVAALNENNAASSESIAILRSKLATLKTFRDKEMIRVVNHFNTQLEVFENRFKILQEKLKSTIDVDVTAESYQPNPNERMNHHQNKNTQKEEIVAYNNAFNDWNIGNYGMDSLEDYYSKKKE